MVFGWDISTAIIGFAAFDDNQHFLSSSYCDLRKIDDFMVKADFASMFVHDMISSQPSGDRVHFIEDKLSGMGGGSNAGTIMRLGAFNAMVSWMVWQNMEENDSFFHLHPSTVKAIVKKEGLIIPKGSKEKKKLTLDFVRKREHTFPYVENKNSNPQPYCFDQADAYITALAGFRKHLNVVK